MDHGFKLHPDGTLEITLPRGKKVGRVLVCEAGTQDGSLYYPENNVSDINVGDMINCTDCIKHGGDWECDRTNCRKGTKQQATKASNLNNRQAAIDALNRIFNQCEEIEAHLPEGDPDRTGYKMYPDYVTVREYLHQLPSVQPKITRCKYCEISKIDMFGHVWCSRFVNHEVAPDGFCSWASRKEN